MARVENTLRRKIPNFADSFTHSFIQSSTSIFDMFVWYQLIFTPLHCTPLQFDSPNKRVGWAESSCDYSGLITENGYPNVLGEDLSTTAVETPEAIEEEKEKAEEQEELKEAFDEGNTETEIHNEVEVEGIAEDIDVKEEEKEVVKQEDYQEEEKVAFDKEKLESEVIQEEEGENEAKINEDFDSSDTDGMETKKKKPASGEDTHNFDIPFNDIKQQITDNPGIAGGGLVAFLLLSCFCCICVYRCCCAPRKKKIYRRQPEVEMSGRSSYKDDFVDEENDNDAEEYGVYKDV